MLEHPHKPEAKLQDGVNEVDLNLVQGVLPPLRSLEVRSSAFADGMGLLEYREAGSGSDGVVLALHGMGSSSAGYRAQLQGLSDTHRVIAWDAPGFNRSSLLASAHPTAAEYAEAVVALAQSLDVHKAFTLVGSSWGSVIAMAVAHRFPAKVCGLVLLGPNLARGSLAPLERSAALSEALGSARERLAEDRFAVASRLLASTASPAVQGIVMGLRDATTLEGWRRATEMLYSVHTPELVAALRCPVAIVVGTEDRVAPESLHARCLYEAARQAGVYAELHVLEQCGHMPKLEKPHAVNALIRRFSDHRFLSSLSGDGLDVAAG